MFVLGIVGGVASGKSHVATELAARGGVLLDADRVGHEVLREPDVVALLVARWGPSIQDDTSAIDRRKVARRVFGDTPAVAAERAFLESITHPRIRQRLLDQLEAARKAGAKLAVIDAALLFETGWDRICDGVLFIDTPEEIRRARSVARGWNAEQFAAREAAQWPLAEKRRRAHWVLENRGSPEQLKDQVEAWHVMLEQGGLVVPPAGAGCNECAEGEC